MKKMVIIFSLVLINWGVYAQHENTQQAKPMFEDKNLEIAYGHYVLLKDALVASHLQEAKKASTDLQQSLASVDNSKKAAAEAAKIAAATSLDDQRKAFTALSNEMTELVKEGKLSMGEVYLEYCPMANNNKGGYWLSNEEEIRNPYFGEKMLKCGTTKEVFK